MAQEIDAFLKGKSDQEISDEALNSAAGGKCSDDTARKTLRPIFMQRGFCVRRCRIDSAME